MSATPRMRRFLSASRTKHWSAALSVITSDNEAMRHPDTRPLHLLTRLEILIARVGGVPCVVGDRCDAVRDHRRCDRAVLVEQPPCGIARDLGALARFGRLDGAYGRSRRLDRRRRGRGRRLVARDEADDAR